jgi:hypothetical protein
MSILVLTSDTLIGTAAAGNIEYNGQFFGTDSNASRAQLQRITSGTAVASTSGTSIDFTGIPAWCKRITVMFEGVSTNGTSPVTMQIGDSGGVEITGYLGTNGRTGAGTAGANNSSGFLIEDGGATASVRHGSIALNLLNSSTNTWTAMGAVGRSDGANIYIQGGSKSLSATLDRVRITTSGGTDTFDAGSVNIIYEG